MIKVNFILSLLFLLISCSGEVVQRNRKGVPSRPIDPRFAPIKKKVVLLEIYNESPFGGEDLGITATEELRRELSRTPEFLVDYTGAAIFGTSKEIYAGGGSKLSKASRTAKLNGVSFVIYGRIVEAKIREKSDEIGVVRKTKSYTQNKVEIRVYDVNSRREIFSRTIRSYADDNTFRFFMNTNEKKLVYRQNLLRYGIKVSMRKFVPKLMQIAAKMEWVGRVAKIIGNRIYLNAGRKSGINIGDIMRVMTEGEEVFDPETGALIGVSKGEIKGTLEVIDFIGPDGAIAILHSGGSVVEGDFVRLY